ncbi:MAG TPA: hypothetical protein VF096_15590 [Azonexus sp.]
MTAREMAGLRGNGRDRRQRDAGPPPTGERRLQAERRDILVMPLSPGEWAEAACNCYYQQPAHGRTAPRWASERRLADMLLPASGERRLCADRRRLEVTAIPIDEWAEAMSNYYYHFHHRP